MAPEFDLRELYTERAEDPPSTDRVLAELFPAHKTHRRGALRVVVAGALAAAAVTVAGVVLPPAHTAGPRPGVCRSRPGASAETGRGPGQ